MPINIKYNADTERWEVTPSPEVEHQQNVEMMTYIALFLLAVFLIVFLLRRYSSDWKKIWITTFCIISFAMCLICAPYNPVSYKGIVDEGKTLNASILKPPRAFTMNYKTLAFREVLILVGCGAGYAVSTMSKKT